MFLSSETSLRRPLPSHLSHRSPSHRIRSSKSPVPSEGPFVLRLSSRPPFSRVVADPTLVLLGLAGLEMERNAGMPQVIPLSFSALHLLYYLSYFAFASITPFVHLPLQGDRGSRKENTRPEIKLVPFLPLSSSLSASSQTLCLSSLSSCEIIQPLFHFFPSLLISQPHQSIPLLFHLSLFHFTPPSRVAILSRL